jgi:hypothetical protein
VNRVHGPMDRYSGRSTLDSRPGQGGALAGAWRTAATEDGSLPRKHLEKRGDRGEPHRGRRWAAQEWDEAGDELQ